VQKSYHFGGSSVVFLKIHFTLELPPILHLDHQTLVIGTSLSSTTLLQISPPLATGVTGVRPLPICKMGEAGSLTQPVGGGLATAKN
jgi:hypothetical protein